MGAGVGDSGGNGWSKGVGDSDGCGLIGSKGEGAGVTAALATAMGTAAARVAGAGVGDSSGNGFSNRGRYPRNARGLRRPHAPARLSTTSLPMSAAGGWPVEVAGGPAAG
jgi:hypothetical protein